MNDRCYYQKHKSYKDYGGRGITVCERWRNSFEAFLEDMGIRPAGTTLGRKDNDGNYTPENCAWHTHREQGRNRRSNRIIFYNGIRCTLQEWSERTGLERDVIWQRIKKGWSVGDALTKPPKKMKNSRHSRYSLISEPARAA
jgi:hypothetical protein